MSIVFTGFDSAWGGRQRGALCDIELSLKDGHHELRICAPPRSVAWDDAVLEARTYANGDHHIIAIDQGLVVANATGQRPVEKDLARALMSRFRCGAHSSNTRNASCYGERAGIWRFMHALHDRGFRHEPMAIPDSVSGRFYFECYPHPALIALFDLERALQYKIHKRNRDAWGALHDRLYTLQECELPIANIRETLVQLREPRKSNEDAIDAIVAAYTAAYWWRFGTSRSVMLGDISTGYIVTPFNRATRECYASTFGERINHGGVAQTRTAPGMPGSQFASVVAAMPIAAENQGRFASVQVRCNDTTNLWCRLNNWMIRDNCENHRLIIQCLDVDGEPELSFLPFRKHGVTQGGMRICDEIDQREIWRELTEGASNDNIFDISDLHRYEPL